MHKIMVVFAAVSVGVTALGGDKPFSVAAPSQPASWEATAVREFNEWYSQVAAADGEKYTFHIGDTEFAREKGLDARKLAEEQWVVKSFGHDIVLVGGGTRGTLYAVYHFLEDCCDIHWWNDEEYDVPPAKPLTFNELDLKGKPYFFYRQVYRSGKSNANYKLSVRNRLNTSGADSIPLAWGGGLEVGPPYIAHTFGRMLPFEKYGKEHPEWYSLQPDGTREGAMWKGQFCLSNPEVLAQLKQKVRESIAQGDVEWPRKGLAKPTIYTLGLNDNKNYCHCSNCLAEIERVGCSGQYMRIVNSIAEEIAKERPEIVFMVSAYLHTEAIPKQKKLKFAKNTLLGLDATKDNLVAPIDDESNAYTRKLYDEWRPFASAIKTYNYRITFWEATYDWPVPTEFVIAAKQRYYAEHGATSFMSELERTETTDMWELKFFMERRLGENPKEDGNALMDFFMPRYYGAGAGHIKAARLALAKNCREAKGSISWFPRADEFAWITDATLDEMDREFNLAAAVVKGNAKYERRIAKSRIGLDLIRKYRREMRECKGVFPAMKMHLHNPKLMTIVDDPETFAGKSVKLDFTTGKLKPEDLFKVGYALGATSTLKPEQPAKEGEWQWYRSATKLRTTKSYFYINYWLMQLASGLPDAGGREIELRARIKLQGPKFFPGSTKPNLAWVDVVQEKGANDQAVTEPAIKATQKCTTAREKIVFIGAHPDDSEAFMGTALLLNRNYDIHIVDFTRGEGGCGTAGFKDGSTAAKRIAEEREVCKAFGTEPVFLSQINYQGRYAYADAKVTAEIEQLLMELKPRAVFTHWPVDTHPDHVQCSAAVQHALWNVSRDHGFRPEVYFFEEPPYQTLNYHPTYFVNTESVADEAAALISKYECQKGAKIAAKKAQRLVARGLEAPTPVSAAETFATPDGKPIVGGVIEGIAVR